MPLVRPRSLHCHNNSFGSSSEAELLEIIMVSGLHQHKHFHVVPCLASDQQFPKHSIGSVTATAYVS